MWCFTWIAHAMNEVWRNVSFNLNRFKTRVFLNFTTKRPSTSRELSLTWTTQTAAFGNYTLYSKNARKRNRSASELNSDENRPIMTSQSLSVLLLGEANFSFSAALSESNRALRITASCLQNEPETSLQENASQNIQLLRDRGKATTPLFSLISFKMYINLRI